MSIVYSKWEPLRSKSSVSYGHYKVQTLLTKLHCMKLVLQEIKFIFPNMSVHHTVNTICFKLHLNLKYTKYIIIIIIIMIVLLLLNEFSTSLYTVFLNCTNTSCNFTFTHAYIYTHSSFGSFLISTAVFHSFLFFFLFVTT